jgi:hypothetical protein
MWTFKLPLTSLSKFSKPKPAFLSLSSFVSAAAPPLPVGARAPDGLSPVALPARLLQD